MGGESGMIELTLNEGLRINKWQGKKGVTLEYLPKGRKMKGANEHQTAI